MDEYLRLLDDARAGERRAGMAAERHLRQVSEEGATFAGTLLDLAEHGSTSTVRTCAGRSFAGVVLLVATDFCVIRAEAGDVWVSLGAVTSVRPQAAERHEPASGDRAAADLLLLEALARVAPERPRLAFLLDGDELVSGELRAVGADVLTIRLDGVRSQLVYVSGRSLRAVFRSG